jgi:hypothetical protein
MNDHKKKYKQNSLKIKRVWINKVRKQLMQISCSNGQAIPNKNDVL